MSEYRNGLISMLHSNLVALDCAMSIAERAQKKYAVEERNREECELVADIAIAEITKELARILKKLEKNQV